VSVRTEKIAHREAQSFFHHYEHLGNCGLGVWHYAAFMDSALLGVVSFGTACFARNRGRVAYVAAEFGLPIYQISRGGTMPSTPFNTPSQVLSASLAHFQRDRGDTLVVAYADRTFNEVGTIYQACNGIYTGLTKPKDQANYVVQGRYMSGWRVRKKFGTRSVELLKKIDMNITKLPLNPKFRYIFVLASPRKKKHVLRALESIVLPYPKRLTERIPEMNIATQVSRNSTPASSSLALEGRNYEQAGAAASIG